VTATRLTQAPFNPVGTVEAVRIGLLAGAFGSDLRDFRDQSRRFAEQLAGDGLHQPLLEDKKLQREHDEGIKPLQAYRNEELARCLECFYGPDPSYHTARRQFVLKLQAAKATHRRAA
jgi:putative two-component system hydrogenase maturation factor HypX/HoxX